MLTLKSMSILSLGFIVLVAGCETTGKKPREPYTTEKNPTTLAGRGDPDLEDLFRPAAWVLIDGYEGEYIERDGNPQMQWVIKKPVSSTPTFRAEAYDVLLGDPDVFKCVLQTREATDGISVKYGISRESDFECGHEYSLTNPGEGFVIRAPEGGTVDSIDPLGPGEYLLAATVQNSTSGEKTVAITFFTVE